MVDISKTRDDLIERAAWELGAKVAGQSLAAEDYATIDNLVDPLVMQLAMELAYVQDTSAIPYGVFHSAGPAIGQRGGDFVRAAIFARRQACQRMN